MKKLFSILLLSAFLLPQLVKVGIFVSFKANQDFIAKVLCINKDKPEMKCNGKCHLAKELNKTENKDENLPITISNKTEITLFIENQETFELKKQLGFLTKERFSDIKKDYHSSFIDGVFHPPRVVLI